MGAPQYEQAGADIGGSGTTNTIPRWTGATTLGDSLLSQSGTIVSAASSFRVAAGTNWSTNDGGLLLFSNNGYKIGFDSVGSTVGYIRYQVDTAGSTLHGHMFSAGALGSPTNLMFIRSDGNVGIGTASPGSILDVLRTQNSTTNAQVRNLSTGAAAQARMDIVSDAGTLLLGVVSSTWNNFGISNGDAYVSNNVARAITFSTGGSERMRISGTTAQVAIGTSSFTSGRALTTVADLDIYGLWVGRGAGAVASNTTVGASALAANTTGNVAVAVGTEALTAQTTGIGNTAVGYRALRAVTTTNSSTGIGYLAGANMTGAANVALGQQALSGAVGASGDHNVGVGFQAGLALTTASNNTLLGNYAGSALTTGGANTMVGYQAGSAATTATQNAYFGNGAGLFNTGAENTAIGAQSLRGASGTSTGGMNVTVGYQALYANTAGSQNTALGMEALRSHTSGNSNTALGWRAGYGAASANANTTGSDNIYVGRETVGTANNNTNEIVIGAGATGNGSNTVTIGNSSNVGTFLDTKYVRLVDSYTVATLPAAGTVGRIARVTDGDAALAWGATVVNTGAGATPYLVWDNGTNWTVFGK